jgi:hypothetical protein
LGRLLQLLEAIVEHHVWMLGIADDVAAIIAAGADEFTA